MAFSFATFILIYEAFPKYCICPLIKLEYRNGYANEYFYANELFIFWELKPQYNFLKMAT